MTMTVKEYLLRLGELKDDADRIKKELEKLGSGPGKDKRIRALQAKLERTRSEYLAEYDFMLQGINGLGSHVFREVLKKRYLDRKPFWKIARELGYSEQYIKNIHTKALRKFEEKLKTRRS